MFLHLRLDRFLPLFNLFTFKQAHRSALFEYSCVGFTKDTDLVLAGIVGDVQRNIGVKIDVDQVLRLRIVDDLVRTRFARREKGDVASRDISRLSVCKVQAARAGDDIKRFLAILVIVQREGRFLRRQAQKRDVGLVSVLAFDELVPEKVKILAGCNVLMIEIAHARNDGFVFHSCVPFCFCLYECIISADNKTEQETV